MAIKHPAITGRSNIYNVDPTQIKILDDWNPREDFSGEEELINFIIENGPVFSPIYVRKPKNSDDIILVAGERRLRATLRAIKDHGIEISSIPCIFTRPTISESEAMFLTLSENEGKRFNPVEEAEAFNRLKSWGVKVSDIAKRMGKSQVHIYKRLILIDASEELKKEISDKNISLSDAEEIITTSPTIDDQNEKVEKKKKTKVDKIIFTWDKVTANLTTKKDLPDEAKDVFFEMIGELKSYSEDLKELGYDPETMKFEVKKVVSRQEQLSLGIKGI